MRTSALCSLKRNAHLLISYSGKGKEEKGERGRRGGGRAKPQTPKIWPKKYENNKIEKKQERHETQLAEITVIGHLFFKSGLFYVRNVGVM